MSLWYPDNDPLAPIGERRGNAYSPGEIAFSQLQERVPMPSGGSSQRGGWFDLSAPVGRDAPNRPHDVLRVETLLGQAGHYDIQRLQGPTGLWGGIADRAVKDFQKRNGLQVDGILNPGGPTILTMKNRLEDVFKTWTPPSYQDVVEHHDSLAAGGGGRLTFAKPPLRMVRAGAVEDAVATANRRTLQYLSGYADHQGLDQAAARDIAAGGEGEIVRYRHLIEEMSNSDPQRAHSFAWGIVEHLPDAHSRGNFLGFAPPEPRPVGILRRDWDGGRTMELRKDDPDSPPKLEPYYPDKDDGKGIMLLAEDSEDGRKKGNGNGGERDGADGDAPLDLRDDRADPKEEGGQDGGQDGGEEPGRAGAENKDDSQPSENAMPKPTDVPNNSEGKGDNSEAARKEDASVRGFNKDEFVDALNKNAEASSKNLCAKYLRTALEKGGVDTKGHPVSAKDWGPTLERNGFKKVDKEGYTPKKGDISVIQPYPGGSADGHITGYTGKQWVSDFKQRDMWSGAGYRSHQPSYSIYRYGD